MTVAKVSSHDGCPAGLEQLTAGGRKLCSKTVDSGCSSVTISTNGVSYSKVCGLVYGYLKDSSDGFERYAICGKKGLPKCTIDQPYIDGVSITHGSSPRQHIWTLTGSPFVYYCPCGNNPAVTAPSFIGQDYFCDVSTSNTYSITGRLWDGQDCSSGGEQCCDRANWFCKDLPQSTTDNIEFRLCTDEARSNEDVYIEDIIIYVQ